MIDIAIIILNYQSYERTILLVKKILSQYTELSIKICIVDNASPNNSYSELTRFFGNIENVEIVKSEINGGYAIGNNIGLRYMSQFKPKYGLVINNDIDFEISILNRCISFIESNPTAAIVSPIQMLPNGKPAKFKSLKIPEFVDDVKSYLSPLLFKKDIKFESSSLNGYAMEVGWIPGSFMFFTFKKIENLDFFDESTFLFCEEQFLARKTKAAGLKNYILTDCYYIHEHSATIKTFHDIKSQYKLLLNSQLKYAEKYYVHPKIKKFILKSLNKFYSFSLGLYKRIITG